MRKISFEIAEEIRAVWRANQNQRGIKAELARRYNISPTTVWKILSGEMWAAPDPRVILTPEDVQLLRTMHSLELWTLDELADEFGVSRWCASQAIRGLTWKDVP